jgi:Fe-S-cluster containining protein
MTGRIVKKPVLHGEVLTAVTRDIPLRCRIIALRQEQNHLFAYPLEQLAEDIRTTGFRCTCCGSCCTRGTNSHIFLLDHDVAEVKKIDPAAYEPAPDPEFCDQNGVLYVSGYALRMNEDTAGSCWFLENGRCRIYDRRFSICRIYPHMLRRSTNTTGSVTWHQFARKKEHGGYDAALSHEECLELAREIKEFENASITQQISFIETINEYFTVHKLRHEPVMHNQRMQQIRQGIPVDIKVFHTGELEACRVG